jgi:hypothetical protein
MDWKNPNYSDVLKGRLAALAAIRENPGCLPELRAYYREHVADFINDWGVTWDPRNVERNLPTLVPFILFDRQREWVEWLIKHWRSQTPGLCEKSRDMGISWLAMATACTLCILYDGMAVGCGSRKEDLVDKIGTMKPLLPKARMFMKHLPEEFRAGWVEWRDAPFMRLRFPDTDSLLTGEAGDQIGRGDREAIYLVDEAQPLDAKIVTPFGLSEMADMRPGSWVIGRDGHSRRVTHVNECGVHDVFRVTFRDGTSTECSSNHLWTVEHVLGFPRKKMTLRTHELIDRLSYESPGGQIQYRYRIPVCEPVEFRPSRPAYAEELPLDPYIVGVLLGDGALNSGTVRVTSADKEIIENVRCLLPKGVIIGAFDGRYTYNIVDALGRRGRVAGGAYPMSRAKLAVIAAGIAGSTGPGKLVPDRYKLAKTSDRLSLLQGLMDTDGSASDGYAAFFTSSVRLAADVRFLVQSLGGLAYLNVKPDRRGHRDQYAIQIALPAGMVPFRLRRKLEKLKPRKHPLTRTIVSVEHIGRKPVRCITVGAPDGLYLTDNFIVTHNSAHLERPELIDMSLSQTTNCRIDMSSVNGMNNPFAKKRHEGKIDVFVFDWRAQPLDAKILTPTGWRLMGQISTGDSIFGANGKPTKVVGVFPQGKKEVHRVTFSDGASTETCADHLWTVVKAGDQRASRRHIRHTLPLSEIMKDYIRKDVRGFRTHRYQVPMTQPVSFTVIDLPLHPYVLGCLLGDGSLPTKSNTAHYLTVGDAEIIDHVNERLPSGCIMKWVRGIQYRVAADASRRGGPKGRGLHNPVNAAIRSLGLSGSESHTKFIPEIYKTASSIDDRVDLLRGLLDTDGSVSRTDPGAARHATTSLRLAEDVMFVARSLGGTAKLHKIKQPATRMFPGGRICKVRESYLVSIRLPDGVVPFRLTRKAQAFKPAAKYPVRRSITGIEIVGIKECQCLKVQASDGLYLTDDCIVTHNSDPRKDDEWYRLLGAGEDEGGKGLDPVTIAQEVDRDYSASVHGIVIPGAWIRACVDARQKLGIAKTGAKGLALDVADEGVDKNALCGTTGIEVDYLDQWSGKGADLYATTQSAFKVCDDLGYPGFRYDGDGLGAGVRGDARMINQQRVASGVRALQVDIFRGSDGVLDPEGTVEGTIGSDGDAGRTNQDYFANRKAQAWWSLRRRVQKTFKWVTDGVRCNPDEIVSISSSCPHYLALVSELSQPTYSINGAGKILINKKPNGMKSPNLADAAVMRLAKGATAMVITPDMVATIIKRGHQPRR